jgi:hypothetical protein
LPFLNGDDLTSSPDQSASRWVINFRDWPLERAELYPECIAIVRERVEPQRNSNPDPYRRRNWWRFIRPTTELYERINGLTRAIAIALQSKSVVVAFVPVDVVFANTVGIFAYDDAHFGLLSSSFHWWWAVTHASTLETRIRYTPTDCFETFPQPELTEAVGQTGEALDAHRRALMLERWEGLTKTYNRVHDPAEHAEDIAELRGLHVKLDFAVAAAYGWDDLPMDHNFHDTRQGVRYVQPHAAQRSNPRQRPSPAQICGTWGVAGVANRQPGQAAATGRTGPP